MQGNHLFKVVIIILLLGTACTVPGTGSVRAAGSDGTPVLDWNAIAVQAVATAKQDPGSSIRSMAMMHVAIYDAVEAITMAASTGNSGYTMAGTRLSGVHPTASLESATAAAARMVLLALFPNQRSTIDDAYATSLAKVPDGMARTEGVLVGNWAAAAMLRWRSGDHSDRPNDYSQPVRLGIFQPPAGSTAVFVHMDDITPFVLQRASQFRPGPPPALTSDQYAADYNEVKSLGSATSTTRTADQTAAALFWFDNDFYNWNVVARTVAAQKQSSLVDEARLFAELNVAMYDGLIAIFDAKYTYNSWRPDDAIHAGNQDGNPATVGDPTWTPLRPTAPHPDYPSAHTSSGAAASTVLASFFGTDAMGFSFATRTGPDGAARSYTSFSQAAREEGLSRIWLGYHTRTAVDVGFKMGQQTGVWTVSHFGSVIPASTNS